MTDIVPETGRTYEVEAAIRAINIGEFDPDELGKSWSLTDFGVAVVNEYKKLLDETL